MLAFLMSIFSSNKVASLTALATHLTNAIKVIETEYANDGNGKDAAIDSIIVWLQNQKSNPVSVKSAGLSVTIATPAATETPNS